LLSPLETASMECVPVASEFVVSVATPALRATVARGNVPSMKVTLPVGVPLAEETMAVRVTGFCTSTELTLEVRTTVGVAFATVSVPPSLEADAKSVVRRLAYEAADSGLLSPELAASTGRVKGVKQLGCHAGNWLNQDQARLLLEKANGQGLRHVRDVAMIAILLGCGLRRAELSALRREDIQIRQGHWAIVDLVGKSNHVRTVSVMTGRVFRAVSRHGTVWGNGISENVVWYVVRSRALRLELDHLAPHDLRRTCAKLCHVNGGELERIQFLLGHASVLTTERYLGCKQNLEEPVNERFGYLFSGDVDSR
jgi:hypothetical protein